MRYFYPDAPDALSAKTQFLKEHHRYAKHCFQNTWGKGYVIFDTKEDVNLWYKEHTGRYFYDAEYEPGTIFTEADAIKEIENCYGSLIDKTLASRDYSLPTFAIGLPSPTSFGNRLFLKFSKSFEEEDIERRFYEHYYPVFFRANVSNADLRRRLIRLLYDHFTRVDSRNALREANNNIKTKFTTYEHGNKTFERLFSNTHFL